MPARIICKVLDFETPFFVSVNNRYFRKGIVLSKEWRLGTKNFRIVAASNWRKEILNEEQFVIETLIPFRYDWDNLSKFLCDGLQGIVYRTDKQILRGAAERVPGRKTVRVVLYTARILP